MKATLTAIALLFAIPGMAIAQDNVDEEKLPERAMENPATTGDADATAGDAATIPAATNECVDEARVDEEDLPERAEEEALDMDECETKMDGEVEAGTVVDADADMADNPADEEDLPERAEETPAD